MTRAPIVGTSALSDQLARPHAVSLAVEVYETQPSPGSPYLALLDVTRGTFTDDSSTDHQLNLSLDAPSIPAVVVPGVWLRVLVGVGGQMPVVYALPPMMVTKIRVPNSKKAPSEGIVITGRGPEYRMDEVPYDADTTLAGMTLRSLAVASAAASLARTTDCLGVPNTALDPAMVAEGGAGRWETLLKAAEGVKVDLRFTDIGDLAGRLRDAVAPAAVSDLDSYLTEPVEAEWSRAPTRLSLILERGTDVADLAATATATVPTGGHVGIVVTQKGTPTSTQTEADTLAAAILTTRRQDLDVRTAQVLPMPWLEAGKDVVTLAGVNFWVRKLTMQLPYLETELALRTVL
ncbi:MAG: hypothetical protein H0T54_09820 [Geodermatophilaceae bacterium]|nr:hypothetical protein [Geodermatophilaceae bacterium]